MEKILGYSFKRKELLDRALTHPSYLAMENTQGLKSYERLEFLGDAVLGLVIAELLWEKHPDEDEGALAKRRAALVCGETLAEVARKLNIGDFLKLGEGEKISGGRENDANLENTLEALMGAMYVDGGHEVAKKFILEHFEPLASKMKKPPKDPKTTLQEWTQSRRKGIPDYSVVSVEGPSHAPIFTIEVKIKGYDVAQGTGLSKRLAEREAAENLLKQLES